MSKKLKLSPWHDGSVKPVNFGAYEGMDVYGGCEYGPYYSIWDGEIFNGWWESIESAVDAYKRNFGEGSRISKWRGVLK